MVLDPRKQRTRQHVIADLSAHHVEGFLLEEGHTAQRFGSDYSYDLLMRTFDKNGYVEPGPVFFQLKAAETLAGAGATFVFDVDVRDYNLWIEEEMPVILVLFDATRRKAYWLGVQGYFREDPARRPKKGAKTVRVHVPKNRRMGRAGIKQICELKRHRQKPNFGVVS